MERLIGAALLCVVPSNRHHVGRVAERVPWIPFLVDFIGIESEYLVQHRVFGESRAGRGGLGGDRARIQNVRDIRLDPYFVVEVDGRFGAEVDGVVGGVAVIEGIGLIPAGHFAPPQEDETGEHDDADDGKRPPMRFEPVSAQHDGQRRTTLNVKG